jgi:hypothetical protein
MSTVVRLFLFIYLAQIGVGFAVGFTLPWLRYFGVI